jgi:hypothetical protein
VLNNSFRGLQTSYAQRRINNLGSHFLSWDGFSQGFSRLTVGFGNPGARIGSMTDQEGEIIAALGEGQATPEQQKEAARIIRDLDRELRELLEWEQRD